MKKLDTTVNVIVRQTPKEHVNTALLRNGGCKAWPWSGPNRLDYLENRGKVVMRSLDTLWFACGARGVAEINGFVRAFTVEADFFFEFAAFKELSYVHEIFQLGIWNRRVVVTRNPPSSCYNHTTPYFLLGASSGP
jgi:hypothetical protein